MRLAIAIALTVALAVTGFLLALDLATQLTPSPKPPLEGGSDARASANSSLVRSFYEFSNAILAGNGNEFAAAGDAATVASLQAHDTLLYHLRLLASNGTNRLEIGSVVSDGHHVVVLVTGFASPDGIHTSEGTKTDPLWSSIDTLSVRDGVIVEYAPGPVPPADPLPLPVVTFAAFPGSMDVSLARFELAPGVVLPQFTSSDPHLVVVETGTMTLRGSGQLETARPGGLAMMRPVTTSAEQDIALRPGDVALIPQGTSAALRNDGSVTASAFSLIVAPRTAFRTPPRIDSDEEFSVRGMHQPIRFRGPTGWIVEEQGADTHRVGREWNGVTSAAMASAPIAGSSPRPRSVQISIARHTLAPGERLSPTALFEVRLAVVESGLLSVMGRGVSSPNEREPTGTPNATRIARPGEAVTLNPESTGALQNEGALPVDLLVFQVSVTPEGAAPVSR